MVANQVYNTRETGGLFAFTGLIGDAWAIWYMWTNFEAFRKSILWVVFSIIDCVICLAEHRDLEKWPAITAGAFLLFGGLIAMDLKDTKQDRDRIIDVSVLIGWVGILIGLGLSVYKWGWPWFIDSGLPWLKVTARPWLGSVSRQTVSAIEAIGADGACVLGIGVGMTIAGLIMRSRVDRKFGSLAIVLFTLMSCTAEAGLATRDNLTGAECAECLITYASMMLVFGLTLGHVRKELCEFVPWLSPGTSEPEFIRLNLK